VARRGTPGAQGLHLGAGQRDARLEGGVQVVVVARLLVACHHGLDRAGVDGSALLLLLLCTLGGLAHCPVVSSCSPPVGGDSQDTVPVAADPAHFAARADGAQTAPDEIDTSSARPCSRRTTHRARYRFIRFSAGGGVRSRTGPSG